MLTTVTGHTTCTNHALNRDGTAALCRASLKPREWPTYGGTGRFIGYAVAIHKLPGDQLGRAADVHRVDCQSCLRKLEKITAEAFDAATREDSSRVAPTAEEILFLIDNPPTVAELITRGQPPMGPEAFDHLPADHPAPVTTPALEYLTAQTVHMSQRVYLYDGRADSIVAGNVVAVAGQSLDVIVVQAWVWAEGKARKTTFYPTRVRSGDQLRTAVETPAPSPFPVGSRVAAHLDVERAYTVDSVEVGPHDGVTRVYLVHPDGERLAFRPSVLAKMFAPALEPFPNPDHLIGERVTLTSADPRQSVGTISGTVARVRPAPLGARHAVAELESGYLVELPASLVEATNRRATVSYRLRNKRTGAMYRVLGTGPAENAPHVTAVWVQREGQPGAAQWSMDTMMSTYYDLEAVDRYGNSPSRR